MDQAGVEKAAKAFIETIPYCPRPHNQDSFARELCTEFGNRYLATSAKSESVRHMVTVMSRGA